MALSSARQRNRSTGVTFIELLVAIAVLAITASFAVPSFKGLIQSRQLTTTSNDLRNALAMARSNAAQPEGGKLVLLYEEGKISGWEIQNAANKSIIEKRIDSSSIVVSRSNAVIDSSGNLSRDPNNTPVASTFDFKPSGASIQQVLFDFCDQRNSTGRRVSITLMGRISDKACLCELGVCKE